MAKKLIGVYNPRKMTAEEIFKDFQEKMKKREKELNQKDKDKKDTK